MKEMYVYDLDALKGLLSAIIRKQISTGGWQWMEEKMSGDPANFRTVFAALPRKVGKTIIQLTADEEAAIQKIRPGFAIHGWTIDRLCRIWLLLHVPANNEDEYFKSIDALFLSAEMNELVALYSALPLLAYPSAWRQRCAEGIRSNIGDVLTAIICDNPYPAEQLDQKAWNQLVLKAFFTEKPVHKIVQLDERANEELALILSDYAHERWAAGRTVHPLLWRCAGRFISAQNFHDIQKLFNSDKEIEQEAAALASRDSHYGPAKELLEKRPGLKTAVEDGSLNWNIIAQKTG